MTTQAGANEELKNDIEVIQSMKRKREAEREFHRARVAHLDVEIALWNRNINIRLPIMSLPREILLSIFKFTVDLESPCTQFNEPDEDPHFCHTDQDFDDDCVCDRKAEFDISQVCYEWRALALACSELWTTFNYLGDEWNFSNLRLQLYLERSRQRLLDLRLYFPETYSDRIPDVVDMILPHASRWRLLCLRFDRGKDQKAFFKSIMVDGPISAESLEVLELFNPGEHIPHTISFSEEGKSIFKDRAAPKLTSLRLRAPTRGLFFPLSSHTITFIQIDRANWLEFEHFEYLLRLPALVSLSLSVDEFHDYDRPSRPVLAPNLRYLRYQVLGLMFCPWHFLEAPLLELLILKDVEIDFIDGEPFNTIGQRECGYFPSLRTLGLISCEVSHGSVIDYLLPLARATAGVTRLILFGMMKTGVLPHMIEHCDVIYWPNLTTVFCSDKYFNQGDIDMIRTRLAKMLIHQATNLQKHRTYQICNPNLEFLNSEGDSGEQWRSLEKGEFHEIICSDYAPEVPEWCSWPPLQRTEFYYSPEADFDPSTQPPDI